MGGRGGSSGIGTNLSDQQLYDMGSKQLDGLKPEELDALMFYSMGNGRSMNDYLRGGSERKLYGPDYTDDVEEYTEVVADVLNKSSLPTGVTMYRGGQTSELRDLLRQNPGALDNPNSLVGKTYSNKGFLSTTSDRGYAEELSYALGPSDGVVFRINFKKGAKAMYIDPIHGKQWENEMLGAPGAKFKITKAYKDRDGLLHVHMTGG